MPEISFPDIQLPDIRVGDHRLRDARIPDFDLRDRLADVDLGHLKMPEVAVPNAFRDLSLSDVSMPDALRHLSIPDFVRDVHLPRTDELRDAALARLGRKPKRRGPGVVPWIVLTGLAAVFAGWWLWTSSMTGPRVRMAAAQARRRIERLRAVNGNRLVASEPEPWATLDQWRTGGRGFGGELTGVLNPTTESTGVSRIIREPDEAT